MDSIINLILRGQDDGASSALEGVTGLVGGVGVALGALAVGAVAGVGVAAVNMANDVSSATNVVQAQLGASAEEAQALGDVITNVYANNFGGSIEEIGGAVVTVTQQMNRFGQMSEEELQRSTENAFALSDAFGLDIAESTNAANALMQNFGLSSQEAFDFITSGMQQGLNSSDDFLDSIGEYSNQFASAGFDAGDFFSIMDTGLQSGVLGTDKIADSIKEMNIILNEGGDELGGVFNQIGLDFDAISSQVASGEATWADFFDEIVGGINGIQDPIARSQAQVAIFGTMAEDLGSSFTTGLSAATASIEGMAGATDSLNVQYNNFGSMWEGVTRTMQTSLLPLGNMLLGLANEHMPAVQGAIGTVAEAVTSGLGSAIDWLTNTGIPAVQQFTGWITENLPTIMPIVQGVATVFGAFVVINTVVGWIGGLIAAWGALSAGITAAGGVIGGIIAVLGGPLTIAIGAIAAVIGVLTVAWTQNWGDIQGKTEAAVNFVSGVIEQGLTAISGWWEQEGNVVRGLVETTWTFIQDIIDSTVATVQGIITAFTQAAAGDWEAFGATLRSTAEASWTSIETAINTAKESIISIVTGLVQDVIAKFKEVDWAEVGRGVIDGIAGAISGGVGKIAEAARSAAQAALNAAKGFLGIESPSKVAADQIGTPFTEGIAVGAVNAMGAARRDIATSLGSLVNDVGPRVPALGVQTAQNFGSGSGAALRAAPAGGGPVTINKFEVTITDERSANLFLDYLDNLQLQTAG